MSHSPPIFNGHPWLALFTKVCSTEIFHKNWTILLLFAWLLLQYLPFKHTKFLFSRRSWTLSLHEVQVAHLQGVFFFARLHRHPLQTTVAKMGLLEIHIYLFSSWTVTGTPSIFSDPKQINSHLPARFPFHYCPRLVLMIIDSYYLHLCGV